MEIVSLRLDGKNEDEEEEEEEKRKIFKSHFATLRIHVYFSPLSLSRLLLKKYVSNMLVAITREDDEEGQIKSGSRNEHKSVICMMDEYHS